MKTKSLLIFLFVGLSAYGQNMEQRLKALPATRAKYQYYGYSVAISGNYAIVGAYGDSRDAGNANFLSLAGAACIYEKDANGNWSFKQKIVASDRAADDAFGWDVAISGNYAVVSTIQEDENATGGATLADAGSAYIFERNGSGVWVQVQKIVASDRAIDDAFGMCVAISGTYLVVSAKYEDHNAAGGAAMNDAGSAYIFERNGSGVWVQVKKIVASDRAVDDNFGSDVSIHGNTIIVGADQEDHDAVGGAAKTDAGSAYIFERVSGVWNQAAKIVASDRDIDDLFGTSVSVSGTYIIVGARVEDHDATGAATLTNSGSAYIFEKQSGTWTQVQKIVASDREAFAIFGIVSISGKYAIVGAYGESQDASGANPKAKAGAVYLFGRQLNGTWSQIKKISAQHRGKDNYFGYDVAISGKNMIAGSPYDYLDASGADSLVDAGAAYIYTYCIGTTSAISPTACGSYTSPSGRKYTDSATFKDTIINSDGCDSVINIALKVTKIDRTVTQLSNVLRSNEDSATSYQWLDCNNGMAKINGAVFKVEVWLKNGKYAVAIEKNGCFDTSDCYVVNTVSLNELQAYSFSVYPNPGSGQFEIINTNHASIAYIKIYDAAGRLLMELPASGEEKLKFDLSANPRGLYLVEIGGEGFVSRVRLVSN